MGSNKLTDDLILADSQAAIYTVQHQDVVLECIRQSNTQV